SDHVAVLAYGRGEGVYPVEAAVLAAVFHVPDPRVSRLERSPQVGEGFSRHVRMAYQIVWCAGQLFAREGRPLGEQIIGGNDVAVQVGAAVDEAPFGNGRFDVGDGLVVAHGNLSGRSAV